ncbi:MAG: BamA/TamA family outer membrane protein [FCB group bacterium]|nr:BamA/TamA family outer membrane protein [FCB group bacterium]
MRISKRLLYGIIGLTILTAQSREFSINDTAQVKTQLEQDLMLRNDWGSTWNLYGFRSAAGLAEYRFRKQIVTPDSLLITGSGLVSPSITRRLFEPLLSQPLIYGTDRSFTDIQDAHAFMNRKSDISYALFRGKPVALIDFNPDFASEVSGIAGGQRTANNDWILTGQIQVHLENIWRSAGSLDFHWERLDEASQKISVGIDEPFPFGLPIGGGGAYSQEIHAGLFTQTRQEIYVSGIGGVLGRWYAGSSVIRTLPTFDGKAAGLTALRERLITLKLTRNSLDDRWLPERGLRRESKLEFGSEKGTAGDRILLKIHYSRERYYIPNPAWVWKIKMRADGIFNGREAVSDYQIIRSGGIQTIRGYPEQFFTAERQFIVSVEGQPVVNAKMRGVVFIDAGWFYPGISPSPLSGGVGFIQNSKSAMIKFYYGISRDNSWTEGQIHFQIINKF